MKNRKTGVINTIDLCPIFQTLDKDLMSCIRLVTVAIIHDAPYEALKFLIKFFQSDRIQPENFMMEEQEFVSMGMKFLHYGPGGNAIVVKPGQILNVKQFDDENLKVLKKVYSTIKFLKDVLGLDLKSYLLKKILLKQSTKDMVQQLASKYEEEKFRELFFKVIHLNELRPKLEGFIKYEKDWFIGKSLEGLKKQRGNEIVYPWYLPLNKKGQARMKENRN